MTHFTPEELKALRSIVDSCIEQYKSSGGDIDYTGLEGEGLSIMENIAAELEEPTLDNTKTVCITDTYAPSTDQTFILREVWGGEEILSTEVVGFYYGEPTLKSTEFFIGKLKAEY